MEKLLRNFCFLNYFCNSTFDQEIKKNIIKRDSGQSVVEYILLLAVIVTLCAVILNSDLFKRYLGPNSTIFVSLKKYMEYSYRHAQPPPLDNLTSYQDSSEYSSRHESYYNLEKDSSRFFMPSTKYPE